MSVGISQRSWGHLQWHPSEASIKSDRSPHLCINCVPIPARRCPLALGRIPGSSAPISGAIPNGFTARIDSSQNGAEPDQMGEAL